MTDLYFICRVLKKHETDGLYYVAVNVKGIQYLPTQDNYAERLVKFPGVQPTVGQTYIVWHAVLNEDNRLVTIYKFNSLEFDAVEKKENPVNSTFNREPEQINNVALVNKDIHPRDIPPKYA